MNPRAVITGLGIVSPIGIGVEAFWKAASEGRSGTGRPTLFDSANLPRECQIVGEVRDFDPRDWLSPQASKMASRFAQFAVAVSKMAYADAGLDESTPSREQVKVSMGTAMGGTADVGESSFGMFTRGQAVWPWTCLEYAPHAAASHVGIALQAHGQTTTFSSACAAGLDAVAWASQQIEEQTASVIIAGGSDAPLSPYGMALFSAVGVLSTWLGPAEEASRPFDLRRAGLVLAEGAAAVLVEQEEHARARGARIYARILGYASASEGAHLRKVDETGSAAATAIAMALRQAGVTPADIDYISAHGNSMPDYDAAETAAIKSVFGKRAWSVPISSLKSMCGQALAASSAMQVVASCLALGHQLATPTINHCYPDPRCDLDYVSNRARAARIRMVLIHAHSLGGTHVAMVLAA